ncbi:glutaredoxin-like protein NrdH [Enterococcus timonensis]|uniref:glutaredoxin-like protein NrdH n=1 Tax=Enterococcus timonensis TaxID=1852364 RepID=UPI0008D98C84|nr:glutaredoxin-like protein NrdH [Enterococcus timonensis]
MTTVYSKNNCVQCKMVKRYLEAHDVPFQEINIDEQPEKIAWLKSLGLVSVPVVFYQDDMIVGFNPDRLKALAS